MPALHPGAHSVPVPPDTGETTILGWRSAMAEAAVWAKAAASIGARAVGGGMLGALLGLAGAVVASAALWALGAFEAPDAKAKTLLLIAPLLYVVVGAACGWRIGFARGLIAGALHELADDGNLRAAIDRLWMSLLDRLVRTAADSEDPSTLSVDVALETVGQLAHEQEVGEAFADVPGRVAQRAADRVRTLIMPELLDACVDDFHRMSHDGRINVSELIGLSREKLDNAITAKLRSYAVLATIGALIAATVLMLMPLLLSQVL